MVASRVGRILLLVAFVGLLSVPAVQAVEPVSPGGLDTFGRTDTRCPTFSWAAEDGAEAIEFVVYKVGALGIESQPVLEQTLPGKATSWTPSLDRCLERGVEYAWSARAVGREHSADWSAPSFFKVVLGTSKTEFEQALAVVRAYLTSRADEAEVSVQSGAQPQSEAAQIAPGGGDDLPRATSAPASAGFVVVDGDMVLVDPDDDKRLYVQLDTVGNSGGVFTAPPASDCDEVNERGRMIYDPSGSGSGGYLFVCDDSGWRSEFI